MSPEAQRIAISKVLPWKQINYTPGLIWVLIDGVMRERDPLTDLNAMHEAEKVLSGPAYWEFISILDDIVKHGPHVDYVADRASATATQRAEAFLRTVGKWEESPSK
jgi:hypothetical protein